MHDKRYTYPISYWCYEREPGKELLAAPPVPCRKDACGQYRAEYPFCVHMERRERHGFRIPDSYTAEGA